MSRPHIFRRVTIIGVGLMGGSLGKAIRKYALAEEVIGVSPRQSSLVSAINSQAIDVAMTDIPRAVNQADLVILAAPVESIVRLLPTINQHLRRGSIVTDLGSTKAEIVEAVEKSLANPTFFVGSHPLVGSEKTGVDHARAEFFEKSVCIMTPTPKTNPVAKEKVKYLWTKIGATVKFLTAEEHDEIFGYISHMPHLLAYGLMETIPPQYLEYITQGLKDTTRIASSSPQMWKDICLANSKNVLKAVDELVKHLANFRKSIVNKDERYLLEHFTKAKEKRDGLPANNEGQ